MVAKETHELHFVVHPDFEHHAPELSEQIDAHPECVTLHTLQRDEFDEMQESGFFRRALAGWNALDRRARDIGADHSVFMEVNAYQPVLGLPWARNLTYEISGILFFPYCRIEAKTDHWWARGRRAVERTRKYLQLQWVLSNPSVRRIFVLNDSRAAAMLREAHATDAFASLPDPVPAWEGADHMEDGSVGGEEEWPDDRMHFLLFGSLRTQKGISQLLEAVEQLTPSDANRIALHLLGQPKNEWTNQLPKRVERLRRIRPNLHLHYEGRFLSDIELASAIEATDVILAPYQRTEGSSGVIGHAARHARPVIGPSTGLIGQLIREYQLGTTIDASSPVALQQAMLDCVNGQQIGNEEKMAEYVAERTSDAFASTLLNGLSS